MRGGVDARLTGWLRRAAVVCGAALLLGAAPSAPAAVASDTTLQVCADCAFTTLADAVAAAQPGDEIQVRGGVYPGGLTISKSLTLTGVDDPVIDGGGQGTLVSAKDADLTITGFTLRGTGSNHDREDAAVLVENGRAVVAGNRIEDALFGIYLKIAHGSEVRDNVILSKPVDIAMRGDGIKIWYCDDIVVEGNKASDGRDIILWYANRGLVKNNQFDRERYGLHLMFSNDIRIEGNSLNENSIGLFVMYSRNPIIVGNSLSNNHGPSGGGLGFKDVDGAVVQGNRFVNNQVAAQIDTSPREPGYENVWLDNVFAFNQTGVTFQPSVRWNSWTGNSFIDNGQHVSIIGGGDLKDIAWAVDGRGNYWSDYAGFDANGDGVGDVPYRSQRLFESLLDDEPALRIFLFSPAAMAVDFAARAMPHVRPQTRLEDPAPLMKPVKSAALPQAPVPGGGARTRSAVMGLAFLGPALAAMLWSRRRVLHQPAKGGER